MRWFIAVLALSAPCALGDGRNGTEYPSDVSEEFVRLGPSSLASAPRSDFTLYSRSQSLQTISEIRFYVEAVHQPGIVTLTPSLGVGVTALVASPGWISFSFGAVPLTLPSANAMGLSLTPQGSTELTLRHLSHHIDANHQIGGDRGPLLGITEPSRIGRFTWNVSAIFRLVGDQDPFASPSCAPADHDAVAGFPYVRVWGAPLDSARTQQFQFPNRSDWPGSPRFVTGVVFLDGGSAGAEYVIRTPDGGVLGRGTPLPGDFIVSDYPVFDLVDAGVSETFEVELRADAGVAWLVVDTGGQLLDPCDPAVRATFGGHHSRSLDLPPGADYMLRLGGERAERLYVDSDRDGFGTSSEIWSRAFPRPAGYSLRAGDCDDTRADVHPDAGELCDGIDGDCDGRVDEPEDLPPTPCEHQLGVCRYGSKACVAGALETCTAASYGPDFHSETCDGLDNDCDGDVDVGARRLCSEQRGVCAGASVTCAVADCGAADFGADYEAVESRCDGLDNDCDGLVDGADPDVVPPLCSMQLGVCEGAQLPRAACTASGWPECGRADYGEPYESVEVTRDLVDNDCDGEIDEGLTMFNGCGCAGGGESLMALLASWLLMRKRRPSCISAG